jgi:ABC-type phosphate/phosphonate transport system ATPase subunit
MMNEQTVQFTANQTSIVSTAIEAHDVAKEYGEGENRVQVLRGVDLVVPSGEMLAIMGPSPARWPTIPQSSSETSRRATSTRSTARRSCIC